MLFDQTVRNIRRLREVVRVLIKYGFEDIVINTPLRKLVPSKKRVQWVRDERPVFEFSRWERLRMVIEELGPTFIKLAQVLSNRPDIMPEQVIEQFEKLQDRVPPFGFEQVMEIIAQELGERTVDEVFSYIDPKPLGSASIGQVHRARLRTGEDVIVKVQRPDVQERVSTDLSLLTDFVRLTENFFKNLGLLNPLEIVATFEKSMHNELDYRIELKNIEQFRAVYEKVPRFHIPKPYRSYCTHRILVLEFISGCKITDVAQLKAWGLDPRDIAETGMSLYLRQIFENGFFHADPHPGNVLVRPNGEIVLIDYGMMGILTRQQKYAFAGVFIGMAQQDARAMAISLRRLAIDGDIENQRAFEADLNTLIEDYVVFNDVQTDMMAITARLQRIIYKYQLTVPGTVFLILRALAILEGIGKVLHPEFDTLAFVRPYGAKILKEQFSIKNISSELYYTSSQFVSLFYNLPSEMRLILKKIRTGRLQLNIEHQGYEPLLRQLDLMTHRLNLSLLIGALLIGSAIALNAPIPAWTTSGGVSYFAIFGLSAAGLLTLLLFFQSLRKPF